MKSHAFRTYYILISLTLIFGILAYKIAPYFEAFQEQVNPDKPFRLQIYFYLAAGACFVALLIKLFRKK